MKVLRQIFSSLLHHYKGYNHHTSIIVMNEYNYIMEMQGVASAANGMSVPADRGAKEGALFLQALQAVHSVLCFSRQ